MYLYKCDICEHVQEEDERFFNITEITPGDNTVDFDFCEKCFNRFRDSEDKIEETDDKSDS